jgi:hypothetical protein
MNSTETTQRILDSITTNSDLAEDGEVEYQPTFGDNLVGRSFNPSKNPDVNRLKEIYAEAADIVWRDYNNRSADGTSVINPLNNIIAKNLVYPTMFEVLSAQMACVKLITLNY